MLSTKKALILTASIAILAGCATNAEKTNHDDIPIEIADVEINNERLLNNVQFLVHSPLQTEEEKRDKDNIDFNNFMLNKMENTELLNQNGEYVLTATYWNDLEKRDSLGMIDIERTHTMNLVATVHYLLEHDGKALLNKNIATIGRANGEIEDYWDMIPILLYNIKSMA